MNRAQRVLQIGGSAAGSQVLTSGTNFVVSVMVARALGPAEFGAFSIAFAVWLVVMGFARILVVQPYVIAASTLSAEAWRAETRRSTGALVVVGIAAGAVCGTLGFLWGSGSAGRAMLVLGVATPALVLQDCWRFAAFSARRHHVAVANDAAWSATTILLLLSLQSTDQLSAATAVAALGVGALVGAAYGARQFRLIPKVRLRAFTEWWRSSGRLGGWFTLAHGLYSIGNQGVLFVLAASLGTSSVGGLRSVQNLVAPAMMLAMAAEMYALPTASRRVQEGRRSLHRLAVIYSGVLAGILSLWGVVLLGAGDTLLTGVFGAEFVDYRALVAPVVLAAVLGALGSGASVALRASRSGQRFALAQLPPTVLKFGLVAGLAPTHGLAAAAWGLAAATGSQALAQWWLLVRSDTTASECADAPTLGAARTVVA